MFPEAFIRARTGCRGVIAVTHGLTDAVVAVGFVGLYPLRGYTCDRLGYRRGAVRSRAGAVRQ